MRAPLALALAAAALFVAACGGDGEQRPAGPPGSAANPLKPHPTVTAPVHGRVNEAQAANARVRTGSAHGAAAPCTLVTRTEAAKIVRLRLAKPVEAPQGPTCVYRPQKKGASFVTVAVQSVPFKSLSKQLKRSQKIAVARRTAYCGMNGTPILYVPLPGGRVLSIAAQCDVAKQFAATALRRLAT